MALMSPSSVHSKSCDSALDSRREGGRERKNSGYVAF